MRAWNPKGSGNGIQYQDTKSLYESPFDGSFATSTIYPDSSDTTSSSNLIANPDKLTDWTLDSQGNWVDSLAVNSPTGGDATTDGNVNFFDLTTLSANYGSSDNVRWRNGDFDGDGTVAYPDLTTLSANYGASGGNVGTLQTRSTNAANEITSVSGSWVTPTYDAAGNMVSAPKAGAETTRLWYVYDAWNRQVIVKNDSSGSPGSTLATYSYDGLNRRIIKVTTGEDAATFDDYFNENWQRLESRKNGDTDPLDQFLWDLTYIDTPVLRWHDANTDGDLADLSSGDPDPTKDNTLYYTTDANHNITALYDADQERVIERYVYDPYGKTFVYDRIWGSRMASAVDNDIQNAGYVTDSETGNALARERYKHIPLATWMMRDFAGFVNGPNLLQYAISRPTSLTDPLGLAVSQNTAQDIVRDYLGAQPNDPNIGVKPNKEGCAREILRMMGGTDVARAARGLGTNTVFAPLKAIPGNLLKDISVDALETLVDSAVNGPMNEQDIMNKLGEFANKLTPDQVKKLAGELSKVTASKFDSALGPGKLVTYELPSAFEDGHGTVATGQFYVAGKMGGRKLFGMLKSHYTDFEIFGTVEFSCKPGRVVGCACGCGKFTVRAKGTGNGLGKNPTLSIDEVKVLNWTR